MPVYKYKGYGAGGRKATGTVEAESLIDAAARVRGMGLHPGDIHKHAHALGFALRAKSPSDSLPSFTRRLSVMLRAGVPLMEALGALGREAAGEWKDVVMGLKERVSGGAGLSRAMEDYASCFPEFYRGMVQAGEGSGRLDVVLQRLAGFLEGQNAIKEKVRTAMYYPAFLTLVGAVVLGLLFTFVVPKIVVVFEDTKTALPIATVVLIAISNLFVHYWWAMLGVAAGAAALGKRLMRSRRESIDAIMLRLFEDLYLARFAMTLSLMLEGGLPMLRSLELAGKTSGNSRLGGMAREASVMVSEGASLFAALKGLPPVLLELVATGERSGKLAEVLKSAAESYEGEFDRRVQRALALLEPTMILVMGAVVGYIVFAVLLPLFQLNQLVK